MYIVLFFWCNKRNNALVSLLSWTEHYFLTHSINCVCVKIGVDS